MTTTQVKIDGFRFIDNLHTTARQIPVFTAIVQILGNKQLTKVMLQRLLINWSTFEETQNFTYRESKGKVTNNGKKTGALRYHIEFSPALGLTCRLNTTYQNTKSAKIFKYFLDTYIEKTFFTEKIFYLNQLLNLDGDSILLLLSELNSVGKSQSILQRSFKDALNNRLISKRKLSIGKVSALISEKYRIINFIWTNAEKYAEHLIAPRYEWLNYLDLVTIDRNKNQTVYYLNEKGKKLYELLPNVIGTDDLKDITNEWLNENFFSLINSVYVDKQRRIFDNISNKLQDEELGESLQYARKIVQSSMSFKLPLKDTLMFISLYMAIEKDIIINFSSIINRLSTGFVYNNKKYLVRLLGKTSDGYITITSF